MFPNLGPMELMIVMGIAVLLFGKRLPEVGRSLGRGIVEFKKGLSDVSGELDQNSSAGISSYSSSYGSARRYDDKPREEAVYNDTSVPKFEVPGAPSAPVPQMEYQQPQTHD
jgi:sec-independent protein translocase protein TatA